MYPLLLKAPIKDYIWGGTKLKTDFGFQTDKDIAAEAWLLSCHRDGMNTVLNGEHKGKTINEVLEIWGSAALGKNAEKFSYFPILIKFIDAKQSLSVQVHPEDEYALLVEGEYGKTEMWYIVDCEEGAELVYGFQKDISKEEFERRIKDNTLMDVCNSVPVEKGDVFFIAAGTLHAIGAGILIAEVQQNSNSTYRVFDFGRLGADGKPRELHIDKALEVTVCETPKIPYGKVGKVIGDGITELVSCDKFTARAVDLNGVLDICSPDSFVSVIVLEGDAVIEYENEKTVLTKGSSVFVPAGIKTTIEGNTKLLYSFV